MTLAMTTRAKLAALAIVAPALLLPMKAAAQQATASEPDYSVCKPLIGSDNPRAYTDCVMRTLQNHTRRMQAESAQARQGIREEQALQRCGGYLKDNRSALDALRATGNVGAITRDNACTIARQLGMQPG